MSIGTLTRATGTRIDAIQPDSAVSPKVLPALLGGAVAVRHRLRRERSELGFVGDRDLSSACHRDLDRLSRDLEGDLGNPAPRESGGGVDDLRHGLDLGLAHELRESTCEVDSRDPAGADVRPEDRGLGGARRSADPPPPRPRSARRRARRGPWPADPATRGQPWSRRRGRRMARRGRSPPGPPPGTRPSSSSSRGPRDRADETVRPRATGRSESCRPERHNRRASRPPTRTRPAQGSAASTAP